MCGTNLGLNGEYQSIEFTTKEIAPSNEASVKMPAAPINTDIESQ